MGSSKAKTTSQNLASLDDSTRSTLLRFLHDVRVLPNESAKTHRFAALVAELFPGHQISFKLAAGTEKIIWIESPKGRKRGRIDTYYGNAIVEFENSLKASLATAEDQLRRYSAGAWAEEGTPYRTLLCVATDGEQWRTYLPRLPEKLRRKPKPEDVTLEHISTLNISPDTLRQFWLWLTGFLFRPGVTVPTAERFQADFGFLAPACQDCLRALNRAWGEVGSHSEVQLAFDTWQKYLTFTYGSKPTSTPKLQALFLRHTYLACLARLLIWAAISKGKTSSALRIVAREVLSGRFFEAERIQNLVEDDFFQWVRNVSAEEILAPSWERVLSQLQTYDLSRLTQDVLKGIYQELVDPEERHDLGEFYTPDWLCEAIVSVHLPKKGFPTVLDPTCGSGSFLRATIAHILEHNPAGGDAKRLRSILENVVGIDIHPLAVTVSRATYILAVRSLLKSTSRPVHIPVYLADSLFIPSEVTQIELGGSPRVEIRFGGDRTVAVPDELIHTPGLFDPAIAACSKLAADHAQTGKESKDTLKSYLNRVTPQMFDLKNWPDILGALWQFTDELSNLILRKHDSIWAFIVRNNYRPAMLMNQFDYIVGNPPWLSYRYIADPEYQEEVKHRAIVNHGIAPKVSKLFTQMELGAVFLAHALMRFGTTKAKLAFVMPRSVLSADQHSVLRNRGYKSAFLITEYWDLMDVAPVFRVPSCVLFAERISKKLPPVESSYSLPAHLYSGRLPERDLHWEEARKLLAMQKVESRLIFLGSRNALSTEAGATAPQSPSPYMGSFSQGATLVPRNCYFIELDHEPKKIDPESVYAAHTDPEQAKTAKAPYQDVALSGQIEGRFLFATALSKNVLPFTLTELPVVALPVKIGNGRFQMLSPHDLRKEGYREFAGWMDAVEDVWVARRTAKAAGYTAAQWLDYNGKLTEQDLSARFLVFYNASGTDVSAAVFDRENSPLPFVVDHKLYVAYLGKRQEADYLCAILNSTAVNEAIKPFQSVGLQGERDIHKKVLELPIPTFEPKNAQHMKLVALGSDAAKLASECTRVGSATASLARNRGALRENLGVTLQEIDGIVRVLLTIR